jgi:hypothetical protein
MADHDKSVLVTGNMNNLGYPDLMPFTWSTTLAWFSMSKHSQKNNLEPNQVYAYAVEAYLNYRYGA